MSEDSPVKASTGSLKECLMRGKGNDIQIVWIQLYSHTDGRKLVANGGWHTLMQTLHNEEKDTQ